MHRRLLPAAAVLSAAAVLAACETGNAPLEDGEISAGNVDVNAEAYETPGVDNGGLPPSFDPGQATPEDETEMTDPVLGPYDETLFD
ncbi:hypothetical protein C882_3498 [Caenispirillum salinarum AK4]|uniref:Uncharacterized protein n=1 Tax=Caenispirillum salinarum AK4 TaxID=1238182 RepID=K9H2F2_9PROT|nr:hypothetical protein [Caenispirillum salinarum]EKV31747.1 hypothetical protein C882_3498 [Caenispirillum salinarum AK4]